MHTHKLTGMGSTTNLTICVRYHDTAIVHVSDNKVLLNSHGWMFKKGKITTKIKMCQAAHQFNLPYSVFSQDKIMRIRLVNKKLNRAYEFDYYDLIMFDIRNPMPEKQAKNVTVYDLSTDKPILTTRSWQEHLAHSSNVPVGAK